MTPVYQNMQQPNSDKPVKARPQLYAFIFEGLKTIAKDYGYNLVIHGSMNRDLDLIAIPWAEQILPHGEMIKAFARWTKGEIMDTEPDQDAAYRRKFHGRITYVINLNRGKPFRKQKDPQYYIDISVIPIPEQHVQS